MSARWLSLVLLAAACASPEPLPVQSLFVISPELDRMQGATASWAARWSRATGIPITVAAGGIPVHFVDELPAPLACGQTQFTYQDEELSEHRYEVDGVSVLAHAGQIPPGCPGWGYVVAHELGHILAGPNAEHSESGIFQAELTTGHQYVIDEASLSAVCAFAPCLAFLPEQP